MSAERESRAWHIAGHAYAAQMCGFSVHKLSLDVFTAADLVDRAAAQRLDPWTMIQVPSWPGMPGGFEHTRVIENLMSIALAGPCAELLHREIPCELPIVQRFTIDWDQAWKAAGFLWKEERLRLSFLDRWIHSSLAVIFYGAQEFYASVVSQLLEQGTMTGDEVQAASDELKAAVERGRSRRETRRRPALLERDDPECLGPTFLTY